MHNADAASNQEPCAHCDGAGTASAMHGDYTWVGLSSDAMVTQAITGAEDPSRWPMDKWDLGRCEETYRRAPAHLQERMLPTLERFRRHVAEGGLYCKGCDNSKGHHYTIRGYCRSCAAERGIKPPQVTGMRVST